MKLLVPCLLFCLAAVALAQGGVDSDSDGTNDGQDCGPFDPTIYPGAPAIPCDGVQNNCSDDNEVDAPDADNDGYTICAGDCDDSNASIFPDAVEIACDGIDQNCNGNVDDNHDNDQDGYTLCDGDCNDDDPAVYPGSIEIQCDGIDQDCDGFDTCPPQPFVPFEVAPDSPSVSSASSLRCCLPAICFVLATAVAGVMGV